MLKKSFFSMTLDIDKLHIKFCKNILGVHSKSTNLAVIAELGRYPMIIQISTLVIKYWLRINSSMYENQLVCKAARVYIQSRCPIAKFNDFLLEMCNFSCLKHITIWKESNINNVVKSIKKYRVMWKI